MGVAGTYLWAFLLLLAPLIFFHELGHFLVAKLFGVKVERFSLGFGGALLKRTVGETEYRLSWLPLGGYVKMLGEAPGEELPAEDLHRSFSHQSIPRRIGIALAGPGMNLLLPVCLVAGMAMTGIPKATTRVGGIVPDSPAARADLRAGDRIVAIDGIETPFFEDLSEAVQASGGRPLRLLVEREAERFELELAAQPEPEGRKFRLGVEHSTASAVLGVTRPASPAAQAGLRTGDRVTELNGQAVRDWYGLVAVLEAARGPIELEVARALDADEERIRVALPGGEGAWSLEKLGAVPVDFAIAAVMPGSVAKAAGLREGDIPLRLDGQPVLSYADFSARVRASGGRPIRLAFLRRGRTLETELEARLTPVEVKGRIDNAYRIGVEIYVPLVPGEVREEFIRNPLRALWAGAERTAQIFALTLGGIWKLVSGQVGLENIAGPIGIGKYAGDYFQEEGWHPYLSLLAIISVNLAILNLLPIPVLDGGHILLGLAEAVRGGPLSVRARELAQTGGLAFILLLMGFAFWNDITRHWSDVVGFFRGVL